jgi:tetratricopeptide (TPR) repeat protein/predicted Ser/Thr protein kinase
LTEIAGPQTFYPVTPAAADDMPRAIGRFLVMRRLGEGGMGVVYSAFDEDLDRKVAIKVYDPKRVDDPNEARRRLVREAQAMAKLSHPNVVQVYEVGTVAEQVFVAMEFVKGSTLRQWLKEKPRSVQEIVESFVQAGRGVSAAHASGIVHRDFKPDNVLIGDDGRTRVLDFGIAHATAREEDPLPVPEDRQLPPRPVDYTSAETLDAPPSNSGALFAPLTQPGQILGTPAYMSPEQLRGYVTDATTDQFSFCIALYEALYGERPFEKIWWDQPPILEDSKVPASINRALARGLAIEPKDRFASMDELLAALVETPALPQKKRLPVFLFAGAVLAGAAVVFAVTYEPPCENAAAEMVRLWDAPRKAAIREAFLSTKLPFAETAWSAVERQVDAQAKLWIAARTDACEATYVRKTQSTELFDLRTSCLEQRRHELEAMLVGMAKGGRDIVERAPEMAFEMRPLEACSDIERLRLGIALPPDRATAKAAERVRTQLAEARALELSGQHREGLRVAEAALEASKHVGYEPVKAEALFQTGTLLGYVASPTVAVARLLDAIDTAESSRHDELAAEAWSRLTGIGRGILADPVRAKEWSRRELAIAKRIKSKERFAAALANSGAIEYLEGRYAEAEAQQREAVRLIEEELGKDHPAVAKNLHNLANTLAAESKSEEAIASYQRAIAIQNAQRGPKHPVAALARYDLALLRVELGQLEEARRALEEVSTIWSDAYGAEHREVGSAHLALANVETASGNLDRAEIHARRALKIYDLSFAADNPLRAEPYGSLGVILFLKREYSASLEANRTMLEIYERSLDENDARIGIVLSNIGEALVGLTSYRDALSAFERAEKVLLSAVGGDHELLAYPLKGKGQALLGLNQAGAAIRELEAALVIRAANPGEPAEVADVKWSLAQALAVARREHPRAQGLAKEASATYATLGESHAWKREKVDAWILAHGGQTEVAGNSR